MSFSNLEKSFDRPFNQKRNFEILTNLETCFLLRAEEATDPAMVFYWRSQASALYKKNLSLDSDPSLREDRALDKWLEAEELCRQTNARFGPGVHSFQTEMSGHEAFFYKVSRKIAKILGPAPRFSSLPFGFGPGASIGCSKNTSSRAKLAVGKPTVSANAYGLCGLLAETHPHWKGLNSPLVVPGRLAFVPKTADVDRSIVIEPLINTYVQKGIGKVIRHRLKTVGCDLDSQETNRDLARVASITGFLATIDLSSASDTLSKRVVEELLPYDWFSLLSNARTSSVTFRGRTHTLHKFSSMGNGFTFELESLIFFAIAKVTCEESDFVSVFGDDIIAPSRYFNELVKNLQLCGFIVNNEKSFASGPFRESCGKDYYFGVDVRPVFVKERLSVRQLFRLHNFFIRKHHEDIAEVILRYIPSCFSRFYGPDGFGDGHLIGDFIPIYNREHRRRGWALKGFRSFASRARSVEKALRDEVSGDYLPEIHSGMLYLIQNYLDNTKRIEINDLSIQSTLFQERGSNWWKMTSIYVHI